MSPHSGAPTGTLMTTALLPEDSYDPTTQMGRLTTSRELLKMPQVISATDVAGEMDYWLTVVAKDVADLEHVLARLSTRGGQRLTTYLRLREIKRPSPLPLEPTSAARARRRSSR